MKKHADAVNLIELFRAHTLTEKLRDHERTEIRKLKAKYLLSTAASAKAEADTGNRAP